MKISIVTPSFNQHQFIERTMRSVLSQQGEFVLEYIIMDGGSTDGSIEIIQRLAATDSRIHWVSEPDHGQSDAINKGLRLATGDVVAFLNSDDVYYPGTLQAVAQAFTNAKTQWAYGRCRIINEADQEIRHFTTFYKNILLQWYHYWLLLIVNYVSQPATFWRRSLLTEVGYLNEQEHLAMDYELWCRFGQKYPAYVIHSYLAGFRYYMTSKSGQHFLQQFTDEYRIARRFTSNPLLLLMHRFHAGLIKLAYRLSH